MPIAMRICRRGIPLEVVGVSGSKIGGDTSGDSYSEDARRRNNPRRTKTVQKGEQSNVLFFIYLILHLTLSLFVSYETVEDARRRNNPRRTKTVQQGE